jgi:membrane protease YdiL (CAAX protease family)
VVAVVHVEVVLPLGMGSVVYGLGLFGVGAVLALVFNRSRSLVAAMVAHAVFNGIQLTFAVLVPGA